MPGPEKGNRMNTRLNLFGNTILFGSTSRGALTLAAGQAAGFLIGMAGSAFLARLLGPSDRGTFELLVLYPNLAVLLLRAGLATGAVYHAGNEDTERLRLGSIACGATLLLGLLGAAIGGGLAAFLPSVPAPRKLLLLAFITFPFFLWISNARELLNGLGRFRSNAASIVFERALLTAALAVAFLWKIHVLKILFVLYLASVVATALLLARLLNLPPRFGPSRDLRRIGSYGARAAVAPILLFLQMRLDQMVLGAAGSAAALGFYVIAVTVSEIFLPLTDAIYSALYPRLMRAGADRAAIAARALRLGHALLAVCALLLAVAAEPAVTLLFGEAFRPALILVPWILAARTLQGGSAILRAVLLAEGRPLSVSTLAGIGLSVNAAMLLILVPARGAEGAALAALAAGAIEYTWTLIIACRTLGRTPFDLLVPRRGDLG